MIKTTLIKASDAEFFDEDSGTFAFRPVSKYYIVVATGDLLFIHARARVDAEKYITDNYGKGFYKLRTSTLEKCSGDLTCTGTGTRKGQKKPN